FDGSLEDVFDLQDRVAISVAGVIEPALQRAEMHRSAARPTTDLDAYDLYLRALATSYPITKDGIFQALRLLERATAIDRCSGPALAWAANCHRRRHHPPLIQANGELVWLKLALEVCPGKASMFSRRQSCRGKSQSPVVRIAEEMETEPSKPIDKISRGGEHESPGCIKRERIVASKKVAPRAEPTSEGRRQ